ncbi:apoptosis inhibitor 5, partial [Anoplophora glabripennis]
IRISAMKVLPLLCKDAKEHVCRVADILAQLLQLEDQDYNTACSALIQVFKEDELNTVKAIFNHIHTTEENTSREKNIQFLYKKLIKIPEKLSSEIEEILLEEGKKIIQDASATEFWVVMPYLTSSKLAKTITGQKELVELVAERAEIDRDFDPHEEGTSDRIIMCVECILPLFNANVESTKFLIYYCDQILPHWDEIGKLNDGSTLQYQFLKQLTELSAHCGKLENPSLHVVQIFDKLKQYMPLPPDDVDIDKMPNLDFTTVECLLYSFHRLARQCPDFLTADPLVLKDFRSRLNYFSRGVGGCKKSLEKIQVKKDDVDKIKIAPAVLDNITALIKDLFYTTPVYKCNIQLSFKTIDNKIKISPAKPTGPQKRHVPITFDSSNGSSSKHIRSNKSGENVKLYTPPSGKFSNNFQNYDRPSIRGRGNRGGRSIRGRGSLRGGWRN